MFPISTRVAFIAALLAPAAFAGDAVTYKIRHDLLVKDLPANARNVQVWFWMPREDTRQSLKDFVVREAPASTRVTRETRFGSQYLYAESTGPAPVKLSTDFTIAIRDEAVALDPLRAGPLTAAHKVSFANELRRDVPNMEVTPAIESLAQRVCGTETNVVRQARAIYDHVIGTTNHYSKAGAPAASRIGSAQYCIANAGGSCTDQHSLFSCLARARGIPTRLHFGSRLQAKNEGKEHDPGYRCFVEYFVPGYGWVPADLSAGNTDDTKRDFYASGLDSRRITFAEGRDLDLVPHLPAPVNLVIIAHVLVDGRPHTAFERKVQFSILKPATDGREIGSALYLPTTR